MDAPELITVIMAGGQGTRFWPLSTPSRPKQYLALTGKSSLLRETVTRISPLVPSDHTYVVTTREQIPLVREQLPEISGVIAEPFGRNTAPCLMLSLLQLLERKVPADAVMIVLPADHYIRNIPRFQSLVREAATFAHRSRGLITLGIVPTNPHTGYGYIEAGEFHEGTRRIKRFVEKPDRARAESFLRAGNFYWNSGMFLWRLDALTAAFEQHMPDAWRTLKAAIKTGDPTSPYEALASVPIDIGVMEKVSNGYVFPADIGWSDVGSWSSLYELLSVPTGDNVAVSGNMQVLDSKGCLVIAGEKKRIALVGVEHLAVIESGDTLLILDLRDDQKVREASKLFELKG